jgi:hypothetical protein
MLLKTMNKYERGKNIATNINLILAMTDLQVLIRVLCSGPGQRRQTETTSYLRKDLQPGREEGGSRNTESRCRSGSVLFIKGKQINVG